jgi:hypothetical protein
MNTNTRVAVCCYAGDQQQVEQSLGLYLHHDCPVTILSPEDAPANILADRVDNRHAGKRAQLGPDAWARHLAHLKILLTYPEDFFLMHESDSFCLDPTIPAYLYEEPDTVWSNNGHSTEDHWPGFPEGSSKMSFQAPWFMSRKAIEAMVAVSDKVQYHPALEWVDLYLVRLTEEAGLPWKGFRDCYLGPMSGCFDDITGEHFDPGHHDPSRNRPRGAPLKPSIIATYEAGLNKGLEYVGRGANMVHSVKNAIAARALSRRYQEFLAGAPSD